MISFSDDEIWKKVERIQSTLLYSDSKLASLLEVTPKQLSQIKCANKKLSMAALDNFLKKVRIGQRAFIEDSYDSKTLIDQNLNFSSDLSHHLFFEKPTVKTSSLKPFIDYFFESSNARLFSLFCRENQISPQLLQEVDVDININLLSKLSEFIEANFGGNYALDALVDLSIKYFQNLFPKHYVSDQKDFCQYLFQEFIPDKIEKTNRYIIESLCDQSCIIKMNSNLEISEYEYIKLYMNSSIQKVRLKRLERAFTIINMPPAAIEVLSYDLKKRECLFKIHFNFH